MTDREIRGSSGAETFRSRLDVAADGTSPVKSAFNPGWNLLVNSIAPTTALPPKVRVGIYRAAGIDCRTVKVAPGLWVYSALLSIEVGAFLGWHCRIHNQARVTIGAQAFLGPEVMLLTTDHDIGRPAHRAGMLDTAPIVVGAGAWVGARATVLLGVTIGEGAVVAAGSVVTRDCEPNGLYAGVPAVRKRELPND
jgi:maltose O-acetyltransferase